LAAYKNFKINAFKNYNRAIFSASRFGDKFSGALFENYNLALSSISKSADLASVAVSNQIIPSIRQTAQLQLSNLENLTGFLTLEPFENYLLDSGKYVGWKISQNQEAAKETAKEIFVSPIKSVKTALESIFQKLSGMPEIQPIQESQPPQFKAPQALSLREELDRLKSQGLEAQPSPAAQPAETERTTTSKTIERTIERIVSGITQTDLEATADNLNSKLLAEVESLKKLIEKRSGENFSAIALTNRINTLSGVTLTNPTISGTIGNFDDSMIPDNITVSNYLPLSGGTLSGLLSFPQSSSTRISVFDQIWIGGTSTTTLRGDGLASIIPYASTTALTVSGTASTSLLYVSGTATSTIAGLLNLTKVPTIAHNFSVWSLGMATSSLLNSSLLINPASAAADTVLFGIAVADASKFMVDAEGDIFANSLTSVGGQTLSSTTASTLLVENNTILGDAIGDLVTFNSGNLIFNNRATSTIPNLTVNAWSIATSTSIIPTFTISTASSPFGFIGIGMLNPTSTLAVLGSVHFQATGGAAGFFYDQANNRVGIGTTTPRGLLGLNDPTGIDSFVVGSSTPKFIIKDSGYVGIGTSTPFYKLTVNSETAAQNLFQVASSTNQGIFIIDNNGRVGIGTTSPSEKFSVNGTIYSGSGGIKFPDGTKQTSASSTAGSWSSHSVDTTYGPTTEAGIVTLYLYSDALGDSYKGFSNSNSDPVTGQPYVVRITAAGANQYIGFTMPVRKGDYWHIVKVSGSGGAEITINFLTYP
jgi:hypothetical protein